jgi:two-component system, NarL family, nitrate/nitrite response regulator NarL
MEPDERVRIFIADDHPIFRDALARLLEADGEYRVVGVAGNGDETVRLVSELNPDLLLLDLSMPTSDGMDVLRALGPTPRVRILVLTASADEHQILDALRLGARGILLKESATSLLYKCIRCVMRGQYWLGRDDVADLVQALQTLTAGASNAARKRNAFGLTPRELEIVGGIAAGETNREIAERLAVREHTVKHHLTNIFDKVGVFSRLELAVFAINHGLARDDRPR